MVARVRETRKWGRAARKAETTWRSMEAQSFLGNHSWGHFLAGHVEQLHLGTVGWDGEWWENQCSFALSLSLSHQLFLIGQLFSSQVISQELLGWISHHIWRAFEKGTSHAQCSVLIWTQNQWEETELPCI